MNFFEFIRPWLFTFPPETIHGYTLKALKYGPVPARLKSYPALACRVFGLDFKTPLGLAAGFDKNAECINPLLALGFGFVEAGTCTPLPQGGNAKPRIFRLKEDEAVINRLGFNNSGREVFVRNLQKRRAAGVVGANIGKNKDSADAVDDYVTMLEAAQPYADYVTVNVSSPNTEGLRDLQERKALDELLAALLQKRTKPLLLKIAPDLDEAGLEAAAEVALARGIDGLIISNTTLARPGSLESRYKAEKGGLSGAPLFAPSTEMLRRMYQLTGGKIPLVGVGGISSAGHAYAKILAGASLVQLYTGLVYKGPRLIADIHAGLDARLQEDGFKNISEAVGKAA